MEEGLEDLLDQSALDSLSGRTPDIPFGSGDGVGTRTVSLLRINWTLPTTLGPRDRCSSDVDDITSMRDVSSVFSISYKAYGPSPRGS